MNDQLYIVYDYTNISSIILDLLFVIFGILIVIGFVIELIRNYYKNNKKIGVIQFLIKEKLWILFMLYFDLSFFNSYIKWHQMIANQYNQGNISTIKGHVRDYYINTVPNAHIESFKVQNISFISMEADSRFGYNFEFRKKIIYPDNNLLIQYFEDYLLKIYREKTNE